MALSVHHLGIVVKDIAATAAHYVECFGYEVKSEIIHDPAQTAYVQFLKLAGDPIYLELVSPDRSDSRLSNALNKGGGLNHVCYAREDIEAAYQRLRS
jgi:methylmalonyl-CoA/ethylmalonyl-CoA epimerase